MKSQVTSEVTLGFLHNLENSCVTVERTRKFCLSSCCNSRFSTILFQLWLNDICSIIFNTTGSYLHAVWCYICRMWFVFKISMYTECAFTPCKRKDINIYIFFFCRIHPLEIHRIKTLTYVLSSTTKKFYYFRQYTPHIYFVILRLVMVNTKETCSIYCWN